MRGETRQLDDGPITAELLLEEKPHASCHHPGQRYTPDHCERNPVRGEFWHIIDSKPYCPVHAEIKMKQSGWRPRKSKAK